MGEWRTKKSYNRAQAKQGSKDSLIDKFEEATSLYDLNRQRLGVVEAVALLVRSGWDAEYVLNLPIDSFHELLLIVQIQNLNLQKALGITMLSALATLFSKDGAKTVFKGFDDSIKDIQAILDGGEIPQATNYEPRYNPPQLDDKGKPIKHVRTKEEGEAMFRKFHGQFSAWMQRQGVRVPTVEEAIKRRDEHIIKQKLELEKPTPKPEKKKRKR